MNQITEASTPKTRRQKSPISSSPKSKRRTEKLRDEEPDDEELEWRREAEAQHVIDMLRQQEEDEQSDSDHSLTMANIMAEEETAEKWAKDRKNDQLRNQYLKVKEEARPTQERMESLSKQVLESDLDRDPASATPQTPTALSSLDLSPIHEPESEDDDVITDEVDSGSEEDEETLPPASTENERLSRLLEETLANQQRQQSESQSLIRKLTRRIAELETKRMGPHHEELSERDRYAEEVAHLRKKEFKVPKDHPKWNGKRDTLEDWIKDMQIEHSEYCTGEMVNEEMKRFIFKLPPYFERGSTTHTWLRQWTDTRVSNGYPITWSKLIRDLRSHKGAYDDTGNLFDNFWSHVQDGSTVQEYNTRDEEVAGRVNKWDKDSLRLAKYMRGLDSGTQKYVKLANPKTLSEAQEKALAYEYSVKDTKRGRDKGKSLGSSSKGTTPYDKSQPRPKKKTKVNLDAPQDEAIKAGRLAVKKLTDGKCFKCGKSNHLKAACNASEEDVEKHKELVRKTRADAIKK